MAASGTVTRPTEIEELARQIAELRERIEQLEARRDAAPQATAGAAPAAPPAPEKGGAAKPALADEEIPPLPPLASTQGLALVGRTFLAFGGAFFLRALTDSHVLSPLLGAGAGLLYAALMFVLADRAGARGQRESAGFHGATGSLIGASLIGETSIRLGILSPVVGGAALIGFIALGLGVAARRGLSFVGWAVTLSAAACCLAAIVGAPAMMPFVVALFALGGVAESMAFDERWLGIRWPAALALDLALFHLANMAVRPDGMPEGHAPIGAISAVAVELALPSLYLSSVAIRSMIRGRIIAAFGVAQSILALGVGLWGAARVLEFQHQSLAWVGAVALLLGVIGYAVAFGYAAGIADRQRNFHFYATVGLLLVLVGSVLALHGVALLALWLALAVVLATTRISGGTVPRLHAAVYLVAAAIGGNLVSLFSQGVLADPAGNWEAPGAGPFIALASAALCYGIVLRRDQASRESGSAGLACVVMAALIGFGSLGVVAWFVARALGAGRGLAADTAMIATARTGVMAAAATVMAFAGRRLKLREWIWLVYPLLIGGALKLVVEDLPQGRPATLFLTLAFYGGALILASRWMRREA